MIQTYKLLPLALLTYSCLVHANTTQEQIDATKAQIKALQDSLQQLEASLPEDLEKKQALALAERKKKNELKTHAEFGFVGTTGNTDTTTYGLDLNMKKNFDAHVFEFYLDTQYADDNGVETKNKLLTELTYDYELTNRFAFSYLTGYKIDKFSGFEYQAYTGPGAKYKLIKQDKHNLTVEGNILYSQDETEDILTTTDGTVINYPNPDNLVANPALTVDAKTHNYTSARAKMVYEWQILESLKFTQDLSYRTQIEDNENYFIFSKTALISKLSDIFSLGLNYKVDYVNAPPQGKEHSDKTFSASFIIDY